MVIFVLRCVSIQRINRPFAPAHSTEGTQRDVTCALQTVAGHKAQPRLAPQRVLGKRSLPANFPAATVRRGDVPFSSDRRERAAHYSSPRAAEGRPRATKSPEPNTREPQIYADGKLFL